MRARIILAVFIAGCAVLVPRDVGSSSGLGRSAAIHTDGTPSLASANTLMTSAALLASHASAAASAAVSYWGDSACGECHTDKYATYMRSGHPFKIVRVAGVRPPDITWPWTPVPPLVPEVSGWQDVEYVIGNFFWKTRFIGRDGFIVTGNTAQYNIQAERYVAYEAGVRKPFDCGRCHTTGYSSTGNQHGLPGLLGTWVQDGIRCEACHGPGGPHDGDRSGGKSCAACHYRDASFRMPWKAGFMEHHQQSEDLAHSPHSSRLTCTSCHDPHRSTVYQDGGTIATCSDCHAGTRRNGFYAVDGMESLKCIDCHMPFMTKSAVAVNAYKADVRGHLFRITTLPIAAADNVYRVGTATYWNQDANGDAYITLDYACLGCHSTSDPALSLQIMSAYARDIHDRHPAAAVGPQVGAMLTFFDAAVANGTLEGTGGGSVARAHLNLMRWLIQNAGSAYDKGNLKEAVFWLKWASNSSDGGHFLIPDLVTGSALGELNEMIREAISETENLGSQRSIASDRRNTHSVTIREVSHADKTGDQVLDRGRACALTGRAGCGGRGA